MTRDELLTRFTGEDSVYWVDRVQEEVIRSIDREDSNQVHPECDEKQWLYAISEAVSDKMREMGEEDTYDSNMRVAWIVVVVLSTWVSRIQHAKAYDPNRPVDLRMKALSGHSSLMRAVIDALTDETRDVEYFPGQDWNPPYGPQAFGGDFV